jgi:hypothetical protein
MSFRKRILNHEGVERLEDFFGGPDYKYEVLSNDGWVWGDYDTRWKSFKSLRDCIDHLWLLEKSDNDGKHRQA